MKLKNCVAYSSVNFGFSLLAVTVSTLLMYFYTDVLLLPAAAVSGILFVARLFDGVVDPFLGYYMDRRTTRLGKYRGYIVYWALPMCAAFVLIFLPVPLTGNGRILWCLLLYLFFTLSYSFVEISSLPILASFGNPNERSAGNAFKVAGCIIGALLASSVSLQLIHILGDGSEQTGYFRMALLFAAVVLVAVLAGAGNLREGNHAADSLESGQKNATPREALGMVLKDKAIVSLLCMYLCLEAASAFKMQAGIYYLKYNLGRQDLTALFLAVPIAVSLLTQPLIYFLSKRIRLRNLMIGGSAISAVGILIIGFSGAYTPLMMAGNILFGMASAFPANLVYIYMAELSDRLSAENGTFFGGVVNSLLGLSSRVAGSIAGAFITLILFVTAYTPNESQSVQTLRGIAFSFIAMTILALALSGFFAAASFRALRQGRYNKRRIRKKLSYDQPTKRSS